MLVLITFLLCAQVALAAKLSLHYQVTGVQGKAKENVMDRLNAEQKDLGKPLTPLSIQQFYQQAPINISKALEPYGYFNSHVSKKMAKDRSHYHFIFHVKLGQTVKISQSNLEITGPGQNNPKLAKVLRKARRKLAAGKVLKTIEYDNLKQEFYDIAEQEGYLKSFFSEHVIKINRNTMQAKIELVFNTGPRYYFGAVYFSKNPLSVNFLRRFLSFQPGQPFSSQKLLKLQNDLSGTVYFNNVNVESNIDKAKNHRVPVNVKLYPAKPHEYSIGLGYGTDTGIRGSLGWQWRYVTPSGQYLQTLLQVSQKRNDAFQASYIIPGKHPTTDHYAITAGLFTNAPDGGDSNYTTGQLGFSYVKLIHGWTRTLGLQYQHENFTSNGISGVSNTILPNLSYERIKANNRINTINGYRIYINFKGGLVVNNSRANFLQTQIQGKYIRSFNKQNSRLILTTDLGATAVNDFNAMPVSQRFFAGGAQNLRGFDFQALGPGLYLIVGGVEWQQRIWGNFYGALFYNAGNAFQNPLIDLQQAAGVGVLYRSPIGPIEVTVAHPFSTPMNVSRRNYFIQFTMGPDL